jgi:hypothetical protein
MSIPPLVLESMKLISEIVAISSYQKSGYGRRLSIAVTFRNWAAAFKSITSNS